MRPGPENKPLDTALARQARRHQCPGHSHTLSGGVLMGSLQNPSSERPDLAGIPVNLVESSRIFTWWWVNCVCLCLPGCLSFCPSVSLSPSLSLPLVSLSLSLTTSGACSVLNLRQAGRQAGSLATVGAGDVLERPRTFPEVAASRLEAGKVSTPPSALWRRPVVGRSRFPEALLLCFRVP